MSSLDFPQYLKKDRDIEDENFWLIIDIYKIYHKDNEQYIALYFTFNRKSNYRHSYLDWTITRFGWTKGVMKLEDFLKTDRDYNLWNLRKNVASELVFDNPYEAFDEMMSRYGFINRKNKKEFGNNYVAEKMLYEDIYLGMKDGFYYC